MYKQIQFLGKTESGVFCQSLFGSAGAMDKLAGAPTFTDWENGDIIKKYISGITANDRKKYCYVLVNALGAGEYFGNNINADYFPWNALCHEGDDYGYKTFLAAHAFQHHVNKDPTRAFGVPVLSLLNHRMKRVELLIRLDRAKAKIEGADGIITRIDNGEFPDVSMGCKVPYDVCTVCSHKSKTRADYCVHMSPPPELRGVYGPNKILPNGAKIGVINLHPRFFDISFVFIGADKTAKVMAKVASKGGMVCLGDVCSVPRPSSEVHDLTAVSASANEGAEKVASAGECAEVCTCGGADILERSFTKTSSASPKRKLAEIVKEIPAGTFSMRRLPELERSEPDLPPEFLDQLAEHRLAKGLGIMGSLGVVLKPHEYARVVLRRMGEDELVEAMERHLCEPQPVHEFHDSPLDIDDHVDAVRDLIHAARRLIPARTAFGAPFAIRIQMVRPKIPLPTRSPVEHPLLDKVSAAYNGYRRELMMKIGQATELVQRDPQLRELVLGEGLTTMFSKTASAPVLSLNSMAYVMGAFLADRSLLADAALDPLLERELSAQGF